MSAPNEDVAAACDLAPEETQGHYIGERWCHTHGGHTVTAPCSRATPPEAEGCPDNERCPNCTRGAVQCGDGCPTCDDWYATPGGVGGGLSDDEREALRRDLGQAVGSAAEEVVARIKAAAVEQAREEAYDRAHADICEQTSCWGGCYAGHENPYRTDERGQA